MGAAWWLDFQSRVTTTNNHGLRTVPSVDETDKTQATSTNNPQTTLTFIMSKSLNFWALPAQDVAIQGSRWVGYSPLNNSSITPLEFTISELEDFVDLNQSYLTFDMRLPTGANNAGLYADGQVTAAEANQSGDDYTKYVYLVNNVAHTMIQQFDMRLNGTLMTKQTGMYAYRAFGETLLNYTPTEGETLLAPQGWVNYLNVNASLQATNAVNDDRPVNAGMFATGETNPLKVLTSKFFGERMGAADHETAFGSFSYRNRVSSWY